MRHGEVYNPDKILYGRLPDYHLSDKGRAQAQAVADWLADRDIVYVVASPLERAQETAAPIAERHGLPIDTDDDLIESLNIFQGQRVSPGDGALRDPRNWWHLRNPRTPSWGEPYKEIAERMTAALQRARIKAAGPRGGVRQPSAARGDAATGDDRESRCTTSRLGGCATWPR